MKRQLFSALLSFFVLISMLFVPISTLNRAQATQKNILPMSFDILSSKLSDYHDYLKFEWDVSQIEWSVNDQGMLPIMQDHSLLNIPGKPILPYKTFKYQLQASETITYVKTNVIKSQSFPLFKIPFQLAEEPRTIQNTKTSSTNPPLMPTKTSSFFPDSNYALIQTNMTGSRGLTLFVYPVYISQNQWHIASHMTIEIGISRNKDQTTSFQANSNDLANHAIILCPDELVVSANELKSIQENDGYRVKVVKLSEMKNYEPAKIPSMDRVKGFNDFENEQKKLFLKYDINLALKIRSFLLKQVQEKTINYLTILGDASYVPPSYYVFSNDGMGDYDQWVPTDYFYMAPDASGDNYTFHINVGRLPVRDADEARKIINKIRRYRKALDPSWFKNAALMGGDTFNGDYFAELAICRSINLDYFKGMNIKKYFKTEGLFTTDPVLQGFKENNNGFLWAFGHGSGDGLAVEPGFVHSKHLMDLPSADKLPIVVSEACGNGAWDSRLANADFGTNAQHKYPTSFAEAVVLSEGAGIAYVGGARINYAGWNMKYEKGVPDLIEVYYMDAIIESFFKQYSSEGGSLGDIVRRTMAEYIEEQWYWVNAPQIKTFYGFTLQGDPTIKLPFISKDVKNTYKTPEIDYAETMPLVSNRVPFFSIDDGINVSASSDSKKLTYIVSDYLDHETPLRFQGDLQAKSSQQFTHFFKPDKKSIMTIRVQTQDFKERRIVFYSRYNYDLVLYSNYDLTLLRQNEKKDYSFTLVNEGIYDSQKIPISIETPSEQIKKYFIENLPVMGSRKMSFSYLAQDLGNQIIQVNAPYLDKETVTDDNHLTYDIKVVDSPIARVGILQESRANSPAYYEQRFMLKKLNQLYREQEINVELGVVPFAPDNSYRTTMDRLNIDMLVLYTPYFYDYPMQEALSYLEQFEANGGLTLGILNLGQNHYGFPLNEVQQFFGIDKNEKFTMKNTNDYKMKLQIKNDQEELFSKDEYAMPSRFMLSSEKNWKQIRLENASLLALSEDEKVAMIQSGSRYLYSGFLSEKDFEAQDDALLFFMEMLSIPLKERIDVSIRSAHFSQLTANRNEEVSLIVEYKNQGNVPLDNLTLKVNHEQIYPLNPIQARENSSILLTVPTNKEGYHDFYLEVVLPEDLKDQNLKNNSKTLRYYVSPNGDPQQAPSLKLEGALRRQTLSDTEIVKGKVTPGAKLKVNDHVVAVNHDGSFVLPLPLQQGIQEFAFVAFQGSLYSERTLLRIDRLKETLIHLVIDDPAPYINFEPQSSLDAPPFIHNSLTYMPVRFIAEAFGAEVKYFAETRTIQMKYQDITIEMKYLEMFATVTTSEGSKRIPLQGPYIIRNGRSFLPIRFIAEIFSAKVDWNADLEMVTITHRSSLGKVDALWSDYAQAEIEPGVFHTDIVHGNNGGKLINPSCMDVMEDGTLMISAYDGMYHWDLENEPEKIYDLQEWKGKYFDIYSFDRANSSPNQTVFRQWKDKLVFTDRYDMYVIDPSSNTMDLMISYIDFGTYLYPQRNYPTIYAMEIVDNYAYLLSPFNGITIVDLESGEVMSQYSIPAYPFDFTIKNNVIMAFCLFGHLARLDLNKGTLEIFEYSEMMLAMSITEIQDRYYLQTFLPSGIHEINLKQNTYEIVKTHKLSNNPNIFAEQLFFLDKGIFALIYDMSALESGLAKLKTDFAIESDTLAETKKWKKNNPSFNLFSKRSWIIEDDSVLVSQSNLADASQVKLYSNQGEFLKDIPIRLDGYSASLMDVQYIGKHTIVALIYNRGFEVQTIKFDNLKRIRYSTTKLKPEKHEFEPYYWTVDEKQACIWDIVSAQNVVFDLASGDELMSFDTLSFDHTPSYLSSNRMMRYFDQYLYVMDVEKKVIRVFDPDGNVDRQIAIESVAMGLPLVISDFRVLAQNSFLFLDFDRSNVVFFEDGAVSRVWGSKGVLDEQCQQDATFLAPLSMDYRDDILLINDAGHFRVSKINLGNERFLCPGFEVSPKHYDIEVDYPLFWRSLMHIQRYDDDSLIEIEHPKELNYEIIAEGKQSLLLEWTCKKDAILASTVIEGEIVLKSSYADIRVPVKIIRKPLELKVYKHLVLKGQETYFPPTRIKMDNNILMMDMKSLEELLSFQCKEFNGDLIVTMPKDLVIMKKGESKARLFDASGSREIELGAKVEQVKGHYLLPINQLLKYLDIPFTFKDIPYGYNKEKYVQISLPIDYEI
jgi:hypothetical protein